MKSTKKPVTWKHTVLPFAAAFALLGIRAASAADYPTTILADNPICYLRLEETSGSTAADSSASGAYPGVYNFVGGYPLLGQPGIDTNSITLSVAQLFAAVTVGYYDALNQQAPFSFEIWPGRPASTQLTGAVRSATFPVGGRPPSLAGMSISRRGRPAPLLALPRVGSGLPRRPLRCSTGTTWSEPTMERT